MPKSYQPQSGVALVTVLLVVSLAAILVTQMNGRLQLQLQRTVNLQTNQQAYWYAMGAEAFARRVLLTTAKEEPEVTHLNQAWAQNDTRFPVDGGEIVGQINDLQSCLNLNALRAQPPQSGGQLAKSTARTAFEELLVLLAIEDVDQFTAEYLADALVDWLDEDSSIISAGGAEDNDYGAKAFPYLPANNYLASIGELRAIEHFTAPIINAIKPYVCVLPGTDLHQININTLDGEKPVLLQALLGISASDASDILSARDPEGFKDIGDLWILPEFTKLELTAEQKQQLTIDSEYFALRTTASFSNSYFGLSSVMQVIDDKEVRVISRTFGREQ